MAKIILWVTDNFLYGDLPMKYENYKELDIRGKNYDEVKDLSLASPHVYDSTVIISNNLFDVVAQKCDVVYVNNIMVKNRGSESFEQYY